MFLQEVVLFAVTFASAVWAQLSMAQCGPGFDWNKNSLNQDPCTVGSMLDAFCRGLVEYTYPPLNASQYYLPPMTNRSGDIMCDCNTVMYSLFMACTSCQKGTVYSWLQWIPQCVSTYITQYPGDIAQGTAVPRWAYDDVTLLPNMTYNDTVAMGIGRDPEQLPRPISTTSIEGSGTTGVGTIIKSSTGSPTPTNADNTSEGRKNVGAIVGGIVGSVVPLTVLAVVAFLYTRRRRDQRGQPELQQVNDPYKRPTIPAYGLSTTSVPYNPSDPSTFPQNLSDSFSHTNTARGTYSGAAEI